MGQLNHDLYIQHFSHPHTLELSNAQTNPPRAALTPSICAACKLPSSGWMYTCKQCIATFTLHASCSQMPTLITHPSHTKHALTLLAKPAYSAGFFYCDACGRQGDGFSYHCAECDFDVHATCASKPLSVSHHMHCHQLQMKFFPPYDTRGFSCDICRSTGANHWLYRCAFCEFDAHLDCATSRTLIQTQVQIQAQVQAQSQRPQAIMQQQWPQHVQNPAQPQVSTWPQQQQQVQTRPQQQQQAQTWPQQQQQQQVQTWPQQQQQQQFQTRPQQQQQAQTWPQQQQQQQVQTGPQQQQQVQTWPQQQQQVQTWQQQQQQQQIPVQPQAQQQVQTWPQQQQVQAVQPQLQNYLQAGGANQYQYQNTTFTNNNRPQGMNNYNMPNSTMGSVRNQQNGQPGQVGNNSLASQACQTFVNVVFDQAGQMLVQNLLGGNGGSGDNGGSVTDGGDVGDKDDNSDGGQEDSSIGGFSFFGGIFSGSGGGNGDCDSD